MWSKQNKVSIRTGDTVQVIAGNDKDKVGKVHAVFPQRNRAIVKGVNLVTKHIKPTAKRKKGGISKQEASIHISNLMLKDPRTGQPTRVGRKRDKQGKLQRYAKKTGNAI